MRIGDIKPGAVVYSSVIRRCHENVCQSLDNALIYSRVFVAAEMHFNSPLQRKPNVYLAVAYQGTLGLAFRRHVTTLL